MAVPIPTPDAGFWKELARAIVRPLLVVADAISVRLEVFLRRKPKLFVNFVPMSAFWCIAGSGDSEMMQVSFAADFAHDDPEQSLLIIGAYPKGTTPKLPFRDHFSVNPDELVSPQALALFGSPVIAEKGKNWTGALVFVDQWHRRYETKKVEFVWAGPRPEKAN